MDQPCYVALGIATQDMASLLVRGGMCPLLPKAEAFGISSSEISVLHQFLSVSGIYFLLTCSPSAFNYMYLSYIIALGGVIMTIITIKIRFANAKLVQLEANLKLKRPLAEDS